jgi:hypothetical protein
MQSNPPNAAALDYPTLTPAQREQRGRAWARSYRTLRILLGTDTLVILAAGAFLLAFGVDAFKPAVPVICGFLILSITLFLALLTLLVRYGPIWTPPSRAFEYL